MNIQEIMTGGGALLVLMTLVQVAPIRINPWSAILGALKKAMSAVGAAMNGSVISKIDNLEQKIEEIERHLENHEKESGKSKADDKRASILRFNRELLRELPQTMEDYIEVLSHIDFYESYCRDHPEYENSRAVMAIQNIETAYKRHLEKNDFS